MVELDNADGDTVDAGTDDDPVEEESAESEARDDAHLDDVADGCGCTEIWEHLSEERADD